MDAGLPQVLTHILLVSFRQGEEGMDVPQIDTALLLRDGLAQEGSPITVEQGTKLGRASRIGLQVDGSVVTISGTGIVVAEGVLRL